MARAAAKKAASGEPATSRSPRTAVLVFHGMGDQRPMETLLGVVDAVLGKPETDPHAARRTGSIPRWIKPYVGKDGSFDLKSVTTPPIGATEKRRYDFFELYWAHLMSGTRFVAVVLWLCDLAKRDRTSLPADARWVWFAAVTVLAAAVAATVHIAWVVGTGLIGLSMAEVARRASGAAVPATAAFLAIGIGIAGVTVVRLGKGLVAGALVLLPFAILAVVSAFHPLALLTVLPTLAVLFLFFGGPAAFAGLAGTAALVLIFDLWGPVIALFGIGSSEWPSVMRMIDVALLTLGHPPTTLWLLVFLTLFGFFSWAFLVPYFGDCARYLRDAPDNIEARNQIRHLGLQVLKDLHEQRSRDGTPRYDRIIVVAHSLGTVVAYDVLRAFFVEQLAALQLTPKAAAAFRAVDAMATTGVNIGLHGVAPVHGGLDWQRIDDGAVPGAAEYQAKVREMFAIFCSEQASAGADGPVAAPWRVSDFVSMGSPLTHAALLMTQSGTVRELAEKVALREFPVAPPAQSPGEAERILYVPKDQPDAPARLQHSAMFALTCWTNLYFAQKAAVKGDFIGGPIPAAQSPGTMNVPMRTTLMGGYFNHVHYWRPEVPLGERTPHVRALKLAVLGTDACRDVNRERRNLAGGDDLAL